MSLNSSLLKSIRKSPVTRLLASTRPSTFSALARREERGGLVGHIYTAGRSAHTTPERRQRPPAGVASDIPVGYRRREEGCRKMATEKYVDTVVGCTEAIPHDVVAVEGGDAAKEIPEALIEHGTVCGTTEEPRAEAQE
jgi:hypothetical protein